MMSRDNFSVASRPLHQPTASSVPGLSIIQIESIDRELQEMINFFVSNHGLKIRTEYLQATGQRYRMEIMKLIGGVSRNDDDSMISTDSEILDSDDSETATSVNSVESKRIALSQSTSKRPSTSSSHCEWRSEAPHSVKFHSMDVQHGTQAVLSLAWDTARNCGDGKLSGKVKSGTSPNYLHPNHPERTSSVDFMHKNNISHNISYFRQLFNVPCTLTH